MKLPFPLSLLLPYKRTAKEKARESLMACGGDADEIPSRVGADGNWTGKLTADLDELAAFDAMRAFLEAYWERGGKSEHEIAIVLGNLNRSTWADCGPCDPAMWEDWQDAVRRIRDSPGSASSDPLK